MLSGTYFRIIWGQRKGDSKGVVKDETRLALTYSCYMKFSDGHMEKWVHHSTLSTYICLEFSVVFT